MAHLYCCWVCICGQYRGTRRRLWCDPPVLQHAMMIDYYYSRGILPSRVDVAVAGWKNSGKASTLLGQFLSLRQRRDHASNFVGHGRSHMPPQCFDNGADVGNGGLPRFGMKIADRRQANVRVRVEASVGREELNAGRRGGVVARQKDATVVDASGISVRRGC